MKENKNKKRIFRKIALSCFVFCLVGFIFCCNLFFVVNNVYAQFYEINKEWDGDKKFTEAVNNAIKTNDKVAIKQLESVGAITQIKWNENFWKWALELTKEEAGSKAFWSALGKAMNTIAYDTATWIGSGGKGQKPLFVTEGWGEYMNNIGDNAAGSFLEELGREGFNGEKFNLCEPDFNVKIKIGLGLKNIERPQPPECTFSKMKENWDEALRSDDFLTNFQDMFKPESNDLGMALTLQSGIIEDKRVSEDMGELEALIGKGWLDIRGIGDTKILFPGYAEDQMKAAGRTMRDNLAHYTGNALIDSLNIFLNQLAITAFQNLMKNIGKGKDTSTHPYDWDSLTDFEAGPSNSGVAGAKARFRELLEPKFNIRGDYNILAELTMCPNPDKAGPTNCVIEDKFREAIGNKVTVGDAIEQGYLNADGVFGFISNELEPVYKDLNYPYRSMIILRKFRIIPVGWELAAEYIKNNLNDINGAKSLGDLVACYDSNNPNDVWCKGLVDPNWVLKAPLNYCKREGYGPEIISEQVSGKGYESELSINRNENYCADEQSCIKENNDGSCEMYGYCTEEKRRWNFNADSCDPNYNTCQTFRSSDGKTVSYLENTLDYGICNIDNVGCQKYSVSFSGYTSDTDTVNWDDLDNIYFDKDIEYCDVDSEGCHEFIRTKAELGANLLINSSFEEDLTNGNWSSLGTQNNTDSYFGSNSLEFNNSLDYNYIINPIVFNYQVAGESFNLSFYAKDCGDVGEIQLGLATTSLNNFDNNWQYFSIFNIYSLSDISNIVNFQINNANSGCKIDGIKLERGNNSTQYSNYRQNGLVYEKLLPDYLENDCYENPGINYQFKDNMPTICNNFARKCNQNESGCSMYTSVDDDISIPAKVLAQDYCPEECNHYDNYLQQESVFDSLNPAYFIPKTARTCGAESAGCDEFTNLDKIEEQGEQIEYYSYLRQCRNPDNECVDFYTWEGSSETGYQLRSFNLQGNGNEPAVTEDDSSECNETIYNLPATDPAYNSDCREFYNTTGGISYHLYKRTISCSDNCHPYRRTRNNIVKNLDNSDLSSAQCNALFGSGDKQIINGHCVFCKNGGVWNDQHQSCIYMAIPGEGVQCSASVDGCREYSGNFGNNMRIILNNDFEGSVQNWEGDSSANLSNDSLMVGGESLQISGGAHLASTTIGYLAEQNKSYYLTFIAKTDGAISFTNIGFNNGVSIENFIENQDISMSLSGNWKIYKFNLASLGHEVNNTESLFIQADGDFFIDNIRLTKITDRYYLIKDSWNIPDSCYKDIYGNSAGETHNLGCSVYSDKDDKTHYLRQFSNLCQESAVGCELIIDTHNYYNYVSSSWNGPGDDLVEVDIDNYIYVVYDQEKECNNDNQGCSRFGKVYEYENDSVYGDVYLKNNPNKYNEILCEEEATNCNEWVSDEGINYFKDPKDQICEWRQLSGEGENSWKWLKKKIKYCDSDSDGYATSSVDNLCLSNNDCNNCLCILDNNDYDCSISNLKTFGYGGNGNIVYQPTQDLSGYWTGICSADESGCSEYIDPISKFNTNMIFNADFFQDADNNGNADGWSGNSQNILLKPQTLYILSVENNNDIDLNTTNNIFRELNNDNFLGSLTNNISISSPINQRVSKIFYVVSNDEISATINVTNSSTGNDSSVELKKTIVEYQKKQELDKETCNGIVNFDDGCVLFNERTQNGSSLVNSVWDADLTVNDGAGISPNIGIESEQDANILIKVTPDRTCNNWLACRSYIKDEDDNNVCFDVGLCDSFSNNGNCDNFIISEKINQTYPDLINSDSISNMSGYVKAGYNSVEENDFFNFGIMSQIGEIGEVSNGSFEFAGSNGYPVGWVYSEEKNWNENIFSVINNPYSAQEEGIDYAPEGRNFLKLGSTYSATSESIEVVASTLYVITAYINTINLYDGKATVQIKQYNGSGALEQTNNDVVWLDQGNKWTYKLGNFSTGNNTSRIEVILGSDSITVGNFYFDDIKIRPALEKKEIGSGDYLYAPQTCRLYSESDSLSCDYYEDSGIRKKGWLGYCLEYDRYPGNKDTCLLWYPIDKVKGEGIEEGAGYSDKILLYYSTDAVVNENAEINLRANKGYNCTLSVHFDGTYDLLCNNPDSGEPYVNIISVNQNYWANGSNSGYTNVLLDSADNFDSLGCHPLEDHRCTAVFFDSFENSEGKNVEYWRLIFNGKENDVGGHNPHWAVRSIIIPRYQSIEGICYVESDFSGLGNNGYDYNEVAIMGTMPLNFDEDISGFPTKYCNTDSAACDECLRNYIYAQEIAKVVTSVGQNKYWSGRVYEGSDYTLPCNIDFSNDSIPGICDYSSDYPPFGSVVPPASTLNTMINPYEWDSKSDMDGNQPLFYEFPEGDPGQSRAGQIYIDDNIQRLFAKSYGTWEWDGNNYVKFNGDWEVPEDLCPTTGRPPYVDGSDADICGVVPQVNNIEVNNESSNNINLNKNGFVNLTFNSKVDSQQSPLVMYTVDWGDNEKMAISGVEMNDRQNLDNPHSVYHLYSYWDLKAKNSVNQDENTVYCGDANSLIAWNYNDVSSITLSDAPSNDYCAVNPGVKIKDNWGWCNNGITNNICPVGGYELFDNWIVVTEN